MCVRERRLSAMILWARQLAKAAFLEAGREQKVTQRSSCLASPEGDAPSESFLAELASTGRVRLSAQATRSVGGRILANGWG